MLAPDLIIHLLAVERPGGGKLLKLGVTQNVIAIYPPMLTLRFSVVPPANTYCSIIFYSRFSPAMVPNSFTMEATHAGLIISPVIISNLALQEEFTHWLEITNNQPLNYLLTNQTAGFQYFEAMYGALLVENEEDLEFVRHIVREWGLSVNGHKLLKRIAEAVEALKDYSISPVRSG